MTYQIESLKVVAKKELGEGQRLVRIIAKGGKVEGKEIESQGTIIPVLSRNTLEVIMGREQGFEFIRNAVQGVQDSLIRKMVANGKLAFYDGAIDYESILVAMSEVNESVRFSKDSIAKWFVESLKDILVDAITAKMPGIADSQLNQLVANYLASFQILAGRNPSMDDKIKAGLIRAMELLPEDHDSATGNEIATRLATVQNASVQLLAL